nr:bifunctional purple acid phosphatase 26-like [Tanacetum cinerariifolium]
GRQSSFAAGTSGTRTNISGIGGNNPGQQRVMKCFYCQEEGHMARQCPNPKRKRDATWFRDKVLLVEAQGSGKAIDEAWTPRMQIMVLISSQVAIFLTYRISNIHYNITGGASYPIPCKSAPVYITFRDGGNQEGLALRFNYPHLDYSIIGIVMTMERKLQLTPLCCITSIDPGVAEGPVTQTVITHNAAYQAEDLDAYDSDCDDFSTAKAVLMANLSSYGSDVLSEYLLETQNAAVQDTNSSSQNDAMILPVFEQLSNQITNCNKVNKDNLIANESLSVELERYKERLKLLEERPNVDLRTREKLILDDIIREKNAQFADFEKEINYLKQTLADQSKEKELLTKTFNVFKNESKEKEAKHIDKEIALEKKVKELDNTPMLNDGSVIAKETNVISIAESGETLMLEEENQTISQDIVNIFVNSSTDINTFVNVNYFVAVNDYVNYVEMCNKCLELEAGLIKQHNMVEKYEYNRISKSFSKLEQRCISFELAMQLNKEIFQKNNTYVNQTEPLFDQLFELNNLKAELQAKDKTIKKLIANIKHLNKISTTNNVKKDIDEIETTNIELEHRVTKLIAENEHLKQIYKQLYVLIKPSRVQAKEHAESLVNQLNQMSVEITDLNAQLQEKLIQELLGYVRDTCPDIHKPNEKLVVVTPINKKKTIRFAEPVISSSTSQKQLGSSQIKTKQTTNNYVSTFTRVSRSTKSSMSKSTDNTKNDRILLILRSIQKKNKVEAHSRIVKSSLNKSNFVVEPSGNANVQHFKLNTNSELICVKCNSFMFDARHELCFLKFVSHMNASSKSKSVKKAKNKEEWKPTGKVFTKIGYNWRYIGRTFTLVRNVCPLTRITATNKVPLREAISLEVVAQ